VRSLWPLVLRSSSGFSALNRSQRGLTELGRSCRVTFKERYGPWALATGAASGVGAEFARQLGEIGLNVAIVAWHRRRLEELAHELEAKNRVQLKSLQPICRNRIFYRSSLRRARAVEIGLLVNNAGFGFGVKFLRPRTRKGLALVDVNCRVPLVLSHELAVKCAAEARRNHLCASVSGYLATPYEASYAASKLYEFFFG